MSCRDYRREFSNALKWCCSSSVIHILIHTLSTVQCRNPCLRALRAQGNSLHAESYSSLILVFVQVSSLQLIILPLLIPISVSYIFCLEIKEQYCYCRTTFAFSPCRTQLLYNSDPVGSTAEDMEGPSHKQAKPDSEMLVKQALCLTVHYICMVQFISLYV